ncbi:MAG: thiamine-monophosphate kinase [Akkermansia sp.]|nr:thiamine-monophosphate kinase [Akkermansia sp.]
MSDTKLAQLGENAILQRLLHQLPVNDSLITGPGDDCAVVARDNQWDSLLKTDVVVESLHFTPDTEPERIGRKALARAVSDIAAMGGLPEHALITVLCHPSRPFALLEGIYRGMSALARKFGISLAGGETSGLPYDGLVINVALTGRVERGRAILRSGGKPGDIIFVSGLLGGSFPSEWHLDFEPRVELARGLLMAGIRPSAMMDLSDGLGTDLPRLAAASNCGFEIDTSALPCRPGFSAEDAVSHGEDYELLLTLPPDQAQMLANSPFANDLHKIGKLTPFPVSNLAAGWQHFNA